MAGPDRNHAIVAYRACDLWNALHPMNVCRSAGRCRSGASTFGRRLQLVDREQESRPERTQTPVRRRADFLGCRSNGSSVALMLQLPPVEIPQMRKMVNVRSICDSIVTVEGFSLPAKTKEAVWRRLV
jgi:hypothetical protein